VAGYSGAACDVASCVLLLSGSLSSTSLGEFSSGTQVGVEASASSQEYRIGMTSAQINNRGQGLMSIRVTTNSGHSAEFSGPFNANAFDDTCTPCNCAGNQLSADLY
jgi:hypothetical protein